MDEKENYQNTSPGSDRENVDDCERHPEPDKAGRMLAGQKSAVGNGARETTTGESEVLPDSPGVAGQDASVAETPAPRPVPLPSEDVLVQRVLSDILRLVGFRARIEMTKRPDGYHANIRSRQSTGILIGHRGNTLRALQYLVRAIVRRNYPDVPTVTVDIGGYRVRRENFLRKKATAVARIVLETGREMALDILNEKETQIVREALKVEPGVRVYALGTGSRRNIIIAPAQEQV